MSYLLHYQYSMIVIVLSVVGIQPVAAQTINEDLKIVDPHGTAYDRLGGAIAIDNGIIAVGAHLVDDNGQDSGAVFLFDASTGEMIFKLLPTDGQAFDHFGIRVAIDTGIVAAGAMRDDDNGENSGSVYLFDASTGLQFAKLLADDGEASDAFGSSVALSDGVLVVGAVGDDDHGDLSGSVYLFDVASGDQLFKLTANDGTPQDNFGSSVAISDGLVVVSAVSDDEHGTLSGSVYVFDISSGEQLFKIVSDDIGQQDEFGASVAIADGMIAVGAKGVNKQGTSSGAAYLFDASSGKQLSKILPNDGMRFDLFGSSIALDGVHLVVGSSGDSLKGDRQFVGSAYLYDVSSGVHMATLRASDGESSDYFANSIALCNGIIVAGASGNDDWGQSSGSAYVFNTPTPCPADLTGDGKLDFLDISLFITSYQSGLPAADFNGDGQYDFIDISAFLSAYTAGCP